MEVKNNMQTTCLNCSHVWNYKGKSATPRCPKCAKKIKKKDFAEQLRNIETGKQMETVVPNGEKEYPLGPTGETIKKQDTTMLQQKKKGKDALDSSVTVKQVSITPPPGLDQPDLVKEVKKKEEDKKKIVVDIPYKTIELFTNVPFNFWAELEKEDDYKLTRTESGSLVPMVKRFLDKNMGIWFEKYAEEFALAFVLGTVIAKRVIMKVSRDKKKKEKEVPGVETPTGEPPVPSGSGKIESAFDVGAKQEKNPVKENKKRR